jgi:hypothetical protein
MFIFLRTSVTTQNNTSGMVHDHSDFEHTHFPNASFAILHIPTALMFIYYRYKPFSGKNKVLRHLQIFKHNLT